MAISDEKKTLLSDLGYLTNLVAFINDTLDMDITPELFKNKIIEDIFFINNVLLRIEKSLDSMSITENEFLPVLKKIKNVKDNTIMLIDNILRYKYRQSGIFDLFSDDLKMISGLYKLSSDEIQKKLGKRQFLSQPDNQISKQELHLLFLGNDAPQD